MSEEGEMTIVPSSCEEWSLNNDNGSAKRFWWNEMYGISMWEDVLDIQKSVLQVTDIDVWRKYLDFQLSCAFKVCPVCKGPEGNEDLFLCCYCGSTVHSSCSNVASPDQIIWKPANAGYEQHLRVCFSCDAVPIPSKAPRTRHREPDSVLRVARRLLTMKNELPADITKRILNMVDACVSSSDEKRSDLVALQQYATSFFQSEDSLLFLKKETISSKGGGIGVVAAADIPAFSIIGVYPGYVDALSGEQAKIGRPGPKYALMDLNCANYFNEVFVELQQTFTPFINEPGTNEFSNCAWIQEPNRMGGRFSVISVREIKKGEELLIGYGPAYSRDYTYRYDAYAFHAVEGYDDPPCFALWHWPTLDEKDAVFVCYVGYVAESDKYVYWETADETSVDGFPPTSCGFN